VNFGCKYPVIFAVFFLAAIHSVRGQTQVYTFRDLQVAYIYNFAKYIKWPAESEEFVIGIYGDDALFEIFNRGLSVKKVSGKPVSIRHIEDPEDVKGCHIIYLPQSHSRELDELDNSARDENTLIVTEADLIKKGASISFTVVNNTLKFKLKESKLTEAGLIASQGLLKLAIVL
jgi:hypothetical protein